MTSSLFATESSNFSKSCLPRDMWWIFILFLLIFKLQCIPKALLLDNRWPVNNEFSAELGWTNMSYLCCEITRVRSIGTPGAMQPISITHRPNIVTEEVLRSYFYCVYPKASTHSYRINTRCEIETSSAESVITPAFGSLDIAKLNAESVEMMLTYSNNYQHSYIFNKGMSDNMRRNLFIFVCVLSTLALFGFAVIWLLTDCLK